jgi:parallel beta-helix repeat protein
MDSMGNLQPPRRSASFRAGFSAIRDCRAIRDRAPAIWKGLLILGLALLWSGEATAACTKLSTVVWSAVRAGTVINVCLGEASSVLIAGRGTAAAPIVIQAAPGFQPTFGGSLVLYNASYVTVQNLTVTNPSGAAMMLVANSDHVVIQNSRLVGSAHGLWISSAYGPIGQGNVIINNLISGNAGFGVTVDEDRVGAVIQGNHIADNGYDGIQLNGSSYLVKGNQVHDNGRAIGGASGIHLYAENSTDGYCRNNLILSNYAFSNHDAAAQDGNGILADQWCDQNEIRGNIVSLNDGAGIALYDAAANVVADNTLQDNAADPGSSHGMRGNIVLATAGAATNRTSGNTVQDNSIVTTAAVPGIAKDALTALQPNSIANNPVRLH